MTNILLSRLKQGYRTIKFPRAEAPALPDRFRGRPLIDSTKCSAGCQSCEKACPTHAIKKSENASRPVLDLGLCIFCTDCQNACPHGALTYSDDYRLSVRNREDLISNEETLALAEKLDKKMHRLFGRSLKLRQVSAGGCAACEADTNVLTTIGWDLSRFGIQFVASPRHADGLLVTGPITPNMTLALKKTYDAIAEPKIVIATGTCAISGGLFTQAQGNQCGLDNHLKVDLYIPGCPPHPLTILDGLLRLLGRIQEKKK